MTQEGDQLIQRRENLAELVRLGIDPYPHRFDRTDTIEALVSQHGQKSREELEANRIEVETSGRILAIRSFGKANFLVLGDGRAKIQVYLREDALPAKDFQIFKLLDFGDFVGVGGYLFRTKTNE
ncbi:MAG: OB-fold nucleic acid binding domain-containing protein, partial [Vicinamibacterales bacterium]